MEQMIDGQLDRMDETNSTLPPASDPQDLTIAPHLPRPQTYPSPAWADAADPEKGSYPPVRSAGTQVDGKDKGRNGSSSSESSSDEPALRGFLPTLTTVPEPPQLPPGSSIRRIISLPGIFR